MCVQNYRLAMVPVLKLRPNGFNPELRVNKKSQKYRNLRESVRQYGIIEPLIISPDGLIINGHRRYECAKDVGLTEVLCVITNHNAQQAWTESIYNQQGINGRQIIQATAQGLDPVYLPKPIAAAVLDLQDLAGQDLYQEMAKTGVSTYVRKAVNMVCAYTGDDSHEWRARVLRWVVKHKMQLAVRKAIESDPLNEEGGRERMRSAINRDAPLRELGWG